MPHNVFRFVCDDFDENGILKPESLKRECDLNGWQSNTKFVESIAEEMMTISGSYSPTGHVEVVFANGRTCSFYLLHWVETH